MQQPELLEDKYITNLPRKTRFGVSTQHYTFTENAFVEMVRRFGQDRYEFYFNETTTRQILEDVRNAFTPGPGTLAPESLNQSPRHQVQSCRAALSPIAMWEV